MGRSLSARRLGRWAERWRRDRRGRDGRDPQRAVPRWQGLEALETRVLLSAGSGGDPGTGDFTQEVALQPAVSAEFEFDLADYLGGHPPGTTWVFQGSHAGILFWTSTSTMLQPVTLDGVQTFVGEGQTDAPGQPAHTARNYTSFADDHLTEHLVELSDGGRVEYDPPFQRSPRFLNTGQSFEVSGSFTQTYPPAVQLEDTITTISGSGFVHGVQTVTTPAGTFEALRIEWDLVYETNGFPGPANENMWLVQGIGVVRTSTAFVTTELVSFSSTPPPPQPQTPVITSVEPNPVPPQAGAQTLTIHGGSFDAQAAVTLRNLTTGQVFTNPTITSRSSTQIVIRHNFTSTPGDWSVQVINPGERASEPFAFQVTDIPHSESHRIPVSNPAWNITLSDFGYADLLLDNTPGFEGREYLSGEWGAAIAYRRGNGSVVSPTWLEPFWIFPDWVTNSNFTVVQPIQIISQAGGLDVAESVITNGELEITQRFEMIDTVLGIPIGLTRASAPGAGDFLNSNRYVLKHTYEVRNVSDQPVSDLQLFQFLHGLQSTSSLYDNRPYPGLMQDYRHSTTQRGVDQHMAFDFDFDFDFDMDFDPGSFSPFLPAGRTTEFEDFIVFHAAQQPSAFDNGRFGRMGSDFHDVGKPSVGVHLAVEANNLRDVDFFNPGQLWVGGAQRWELGALQPGAVASFDVLLSILTGTRATAAEPSGIANGGADVIGGVNYHFLHLLSSGSLFASYAAADAQELQQRLEAGLFGEATFALPGETLQVWDVSFSGEFGSLLRLSFGYDPQLLGPEIDPAELAIYHWTGSSWESLGGTVDPERNIISFNTTSLSPFALGLAGDEGPVATHAVPFGSGGARSVSYIDSDGTSIQVQLKGAQGTLHFTGTGIEMVTRKNRVLVVGSNLAVAELLLEDADRAVLAVKTNKRGDGRAVWRGLSVQGSVRQIKAPNIDLAGDLTVSGLAASVTLGNVAGQSSISLGGTAGDRPVTLKLNTLLDVVLTSGAAIKTLALSAWSGGALTAGSVGTLQVARDWSADLTLTDSSPRLTLGKANVRGWFDAATLNSAGSIGSFIAAGVRGSRIYAGLGEGVEVPSAREDLDAETRAGIGSFTIKGIKRQLGPSLIDSHIAAWSLGKVRLGMVSGSSGQDSVGLLATSIGSYQRRTLGKPVKLARLSPATSSIADGLADSQGKFSVQVV